MTRKTRALAATIVAGALAGAVAIPAMSGAQTDAGRQITVRMKVTGGAQFHHGRPSSGDRLATGDSVIVRLRMASAAGARLGSAHTQCVNVGAGASGAAALLQCTQTYRFADGQVVAAGLVRFSQVDRMQIPIVGGSGAYRGATGQLTAGAPVKGFDSVDVLSLDG